jgi:hypothetical protein
MIANRQLGTLLPTLRVQLPAVLRRNGIPAQLGDGNRPPVADQVVTVRPQMASESTGGSWVSPNGTNNGGRRPAADRDPPTGRAAALARHRARARQHLASRLDAMERRDGRRTSRARC